MHLEGPSVCGPGGAGPILLASEDLQGSRKQDDYSRSLRQRGCSVVLGRGLLRSSLLLLRISYKAWPLCSPLLNET